MESDHLDPNPLLSKVPLTTDGSSEITLAVVCVGFQNGPDTLKALSNLRCAVMVTMAMSGTGLSSSSQLLGKVGQPHHKQERNTFRLPAVFKSYKSYINPAPAPAPSMKL